MKIDYYLGLDAAKHKVRVALRGSAERILLERDLPVSAVGRRELLALLGHHLSAGASLLVLIEATGVLHLHWAAALAKAGHAVAVINPLMARRLYRVKNSLSCASSLAASLPSSDKINPTNQRKCSPLHTPPNLKPLTTSHSLFPSRS